MPVLEDTRETKTVTLVNCKGGEVTVYTSLLARDIEAITKHKDPNSIIFPLTLLIKDWNLTDDKGVQLAINENFVGRLQLGDLRRIMKATGIEDGNFLAEAQGEETDEPAQTSKQTSEPGTIS